jgi:hypothetical protein
VVRVFDFEILTVREGEVGCSHVVREFKFGILAVGNPFRTIGASQFRLQG